MAGLVDVIARHLDGALKRAVALGREAQLDELARADIERCRRSVNKDKTSLINPRHKPNRQDRTVTISIAASTSFNPLKTPLAPGIAPLHSEQLLPPFKMSTAPGIIPFHNDQHANRYLNFSTS